MSSTEGTRAWKYLRHNPAYIEARRMTAEPAPEAPALAELLKEPEVRL